MKISRFFASGTRARLAAGADRDLMMLLAVLCIALGYSWFATPNLWLQAGFMILAVLLFAVGHYWLCKMAKADPLMVRVKLRALRYKHYYAAQTKFSADPPIPEKHWIHSF